jgi:hypothetical protein
MLNSLIWVIAIIVLNGVVASLAKKAQAKAEAARQAGATGTARSAGAIETLAPVSPPPDAARSADKGPRVLAKGGGAGKNAGRLRADRSGSGRSATAATPTKPPKAVRQPPVAPRPSSAPAAFPVAGSSRGSTPAPTTTARGGDSAAALLSRQHVVDSVARVRAAEAKVAGLPNVEIARTTARSASQSNRQASELAGLLRNPAQVRRAFVLGEVLGRPRAERPL